jgi:hypothetical protein
MVSHTVLLVVGGALLTGLLGALVFGSSGTAEERRIREQQKLLRALEAQRRIRDAQLMRQAKLVQATEEPGPDDRATKRQRKRDEKEQAAALSSAREAEKHAQRRAEQERKSAVKSEQATRIAAERHQRDEARAAQKAATRELAAQPKPAPTAVVDEVADKPLSELPLFSWATRIENEDRDAAP